MFGFLTHLLPKTKSVTSIESLFGGLPIHRFGAYEDYLKAGSRKVWATWKATDIVAQTVMDTPMKVQRKGTSTEVKIPDLQLLMSYPNDGETWADLIYRTVFHIKWTGNGYWLKEGGTLADNSKPTALYNLNPKRMKIVTDTGRRVLGYIYSADGKQLLLDPEEVMHFKRAHPDNDHYGLGDIEAGEPLLNDHINRNKWAQGFWKNGASPSGDLF
jgi:HK97 family phage portal protein